MARVDPASRSLDVFRALRSSRESVFLLADFVFERTKSLSIRQAREEVALDKAGGKNVYTMDWSDRGDLLTVCFFGDSEHEVLDRLAVAEVMLG